MNYPQIAEIGRPSTGEPPPGRSMFRIQVLDAADLAIVSWTGTITTKEDTEALRQAVTARLAKVNVVLDFSEVETFSLDVLAMLGTLWQTADRQPTRLTILNPSLAFRL